MSFRLAARGLIRTPGFTVTAVAALALGIGANTAIFSLVNQVLLNPPGIVEPERVVSVRARYEKLNMASIDMSPTDFDDARKSSAIFDAVAAQGEGDFNYTGTTTPERLQGAAVTYRWFDVFGARALLGRTFQAEEDLPKVNQVVVLSYAGWKRLFGGDPSIVGRTMELNYKPYRIVGVMRPEFRWPRQVDLWAPLGDDPKEYAEDNRFNEHLYTVARLKSGVSFEQANAHMNMLSDHVRAGDGNGRFARSSGWGMFVMPIADQAAGDTKKPLLVLLGAVGFVLLIACANIAGLMLARASGRIRDVAVRVALGASRWDLLRQSMAESMLLALLGAVAGLGLAYAGTTLLLMLAPENAVAGIEPQLSLPVMAFTALMSIGAGFLFGLAPAWQTARVDPHENLKGSGRSGTPNAARQRLRSILVVSEVAVALVLLVGAGLFLRSMARLEAVNPGFHPEGVVTATFSLPASRYGKPEQQIAFYRALEEKLAALPGVTAAALSVPLPFSGQEGSSSFRILGKTVLPGDPGPHGNIRVASPDYFRALGIPLKAGRYFT
ncbi:MAG: ABC transporter permease, partial [Bryobacteraceae bacterium]